VRAACRFAIEHPALMRLMFSAEFENLTEPNERLEAAATRAYRVLQSGARETLGQPLPSQKSATPRSLAGPSRTEPPRWG